MDDNNVLESSFLVVMLTKSKVSTAQVSSSSSTPPPQISAPVVPIPPASAPGPASPASPASPAGPDHTIAAAAGHDTSTSTPGTTTTTSTGGIYGHAASNVVAGSVLEQTIQQIMELGSGSWDRDTIVRALRAAYNNPERAVEYLYSGIPESAEVAIPVPPPAVPDSTETGGVPVVPAQASPLGGPNSVPLNLFPQGMPGIADARGAVGTLDFLRNNLQFRALRSMVQVNPQILQPMLQELGKQNPQLLRLINENQSEFLDLVNEPIAEGAEGNLLENLVGAMPQTINVTPEEQEAIDRLEAMGFERARVIEAFLACDKNEQLAANYLLEHAAEFDE